MTGARPWMGQVWLNPPRAEPPDVQFLMLSARAARTLRAVVAEAIATATGEQRALLADIEADLEYGGLPPNDAVISCEATWHPANQLSRLMPAVLDHLTRWTGGECVVANAIERAAGVEAALNGWEGVETVARAARHRAQSATERAYGRVTPPGTYLAQACHVHLDEPEDGCLDCHPEVSDGRA
jgi:hypothetical protein